MRSEAQGGCDEAGGPDRESLVGRIHLQLAALGQPVSAGAADRHVLDSAADLIRLYRERSDLLARYLCPPDHRIQSFLDAFFSEQGVPCSARLPGATFVLDRPELACELSLPRGGNRFRSALLESYRTRQGVLHNPRSDRRTTNGVFHVVEGGLPIPGDKKATPVEAFARLLELAMSPPAKSLRLPYTSEDPTPAQVWVSLYLRPLVSPPVPGRQEARAMETRFFAPGSLVANLDFVERIFGNAGNPALAENDAGLDVRHWCGTSGCVVLAPHLVTARKKDLGLPRFEDATERQRRDGMCWSDEEERYNDGQPFKLVCRDHRGVIFTIIADNYFGYSKKEVKSQISYSANLFGGCEEEHAGGALVFPRQALGDAFQADGRTRSDGYSFEQVAQTCAEVLSVAPEGYGVDRVYPDVLYLPEDARFELQGQRISWSAAGEPRELRLRAGYCYILPSGYRVSMEKDEKAHTWRLVGTAPEGLHFHKPCTVSGGGKSEISKSISGSVLYGPVHVNDIHADLDQVDGVLRGDYSGIYRDRLAGLLDVQSLLSSLRPLGSVIRLLTPSATEYTDRHNEWLSRMPQHIRALVFLIKRYYEPEWGDDWRRHFSVDLINGRPSHELRYDGRKLIASYLRVGFDEQGAWRVFNLRQDFVPAERIQTEDDITASVTLPIEGPAPAWAPAGAQSLKFVANCERQLFQRPDEAIVKGADRQTEQDLAQAGNFISNFQPLTSADARGIVEDVMELDRYTAPMGQVVRAATALGEGEYFVSSAHPRIVDGKPSQNFRYLQRRPDLVDPRRSHIAEVAARLHRRLPAGVPVTFPVGTVIPGRRNNPPDPKAGIRPLSVYSPVHYQELPELFMDFVCSLTGKSPSTTGAGSEGAMTKGPFSALAGTADLNAALVSYILSGHHGFTTAAGYVGSRRRIDHDISMMFPEVWCRMRPRDRDPAQLVAGGCLEKIEDFDYQGRRVLASRLGYRITDRFVHAFFGGVFDDPLSVFDEAMLRPESQDLAAFVDGIENIVEAQRRVARTYLEDGTVEDACPPVKALLHIMAEGSFLGMTAESPAFREMFTRAYLIDSDWYLERLALKHAVDVDLWRRHVAYLEQVRAGRQSVGGGQDPLGLAERIEEARRELERVSHPAYRAELLGTLGADPILRRAARVRAGSGRGVKRTRPSAEAEARGSHSDAGWPRSRSRAGRRPTVR